MIKNTKPKRRWTMYERIVLHGRKVCYGCKKWRRCSDSKDHVVMCDERQGYNNE